MSRSVGTLKVNFNVDTRSLNQGLGRATSSFKSFGSSLGRMAIGLSIAVTAPLVAIGASAVKMAADLEASYMKIKNLAGVSTSELGKMKSGIRGMSDQFGISQIELAGGAYAAASAGIRDAATNLKIVEQASKGSLQGLGSVENISRALTAVLNVYGKENITAARAAETLFNTVKEGEIETASLATTIGRVLAPAAALGISFEEVGANLAVYTRAGVNAEEAVTGLRNVMSSIASPTEEFKTALKRARTSVDEVRGSIETNGLARTLVNLVSTLERSGQSVEDLFGNIRGLVNVLSVTGKQAEDYISIVDEMQKANGNLSKGAVDMGSTLKFSMEQARVAVENAKIELGYELAPIVMKLMNGVRALAAEFKGLTSEQKENLIQWSIMAASLPIVLGLMSAFSNIIGNYVVPGIQKMAAAFKTFNTYSLTFKATTGLLIAAGFTVWLFWNEIVDVTNKATVAVENWGKKSAFWNGVVKGTTDWVKSVKNQWAGLLLDIDAGFLLIQGKTKEAGEKAALATLVKRGAIAPEIVSQLPSEAGNAFVDKLGQRLTETGGYIKKLFGDIFGSLDIMGWLDGALDQFNSFSAGVKQSAEDLKRDFNLSELFILDAKSITGKSGEDWDTVTSILREELKSINMEIETLQRSLQRDVLAENPMEQWELDFTSRQLSLLTDTAEKYGNTIDDISKMLGSGNVVDMMTFFGRVDWQIEDINQLIELYQKLQKEIKKFKESTITFSKGEMDLSEQADRWNAALQSMRDMFGDGWLPSKLFSDIWSWSDKLVQIWNVWGEKIQMVMQGLMAIGTIVSGIGERRIRSIEEAYQKEIDYINKSKSNEKQKADAITKIEQERDEKIAKQKRRMAIFDKILAVAQSVVNTFAAVAKASPDPTMMALAAAAGSLATAGIIATPIPKYAKGGIFRGRTIGEIGEYAGARHNPEVVSPLSDLKKLLGGSDVYVRGEIDGYRLAIVQQNAAQRYKRL